MKITDLMKEPTLKISMQYFADAEAPETGAEAPETPAPEKEPTFDEMLSNKAFQSEFDKRVAKALESAKAKWDADTQAKLDEAEKVAKMKADEKAEYERQKAEKALAEREAAVTRRELKAGAIDKLTEMELPAEIADLLTYTDEKTRDESLEKTVGIVNKIAEKIAVSRQRGAVPKAGTPNTGKPYDNMTLDELSERLETNPNERDAILQAIRSKKK